MVTDPLFYELFMFSPETLFFLIGMRADLAREMASRYQYEAIEFKKTSRHCDGVFVPRQTDLPLYFLEVQFYPLSSVFANLLVKVFTYLEKNNPGQAFRGVVLFADRSLEPRETAPYQALFDAGLIHRFYLNEMPELANAPIGLSILYLIRQAEGQAPITAREMIRRVKSEIEDQALRKDLVELIEKVVIYKLPLLSREEIQAMLQVHDIRETRVYQEAKEEGLKEGIEKGIEKATTRAILRMAANSMTAEQVAMILELDVELVRQTIAGGDRE